MDDVPHFQARERKQKPLRRLRHFEKKQSMLTLYITTLSKTPIFCTPLSSKTPTRQQPVGRLKVGRYISEFQHSLQGIYTRTARIKNQWPVDYVKTYS